MLTIDLKLLKGGEGMPRGDGTGPSGMGPLTGRGAGYCAGYPNPGFGCGRGWRRMRGGGRFGYPARIFPDTYAALLAKRH